MKTSDIQVRFLWSAGRVPGLTACAGLGMVDTMIDAARRGLGRAAVMLICLGWLCLPALAGFKEEQNRYPRVRQARANVEENLRTMFGHTGLAYPPREIFIRVFKLDSQLELWARARLADPFRKVKTYRICASSGELGPKRREGDLQVPEGFYQVTVFNPWSQFHLSLQINYPNRSDRILGDRYRPGGTIFIHGNCVTIGCIPIQDGPIEEVYIAAVDARSAGQARIPVHIFPTRMDESWKLLSDLATGKPGLLAFWQNLREGYRLFNNLHSLPNFIIDLNGKYVFLF